MSLTYTGSAQTTQNSLVAGWNIEHNLACLLTLCSSVMKSQLVDRFLRNYIFFDNEYYSNILQQQY